MDRPTRDQVMRWYSFYILGETHVRHVIWGELDVIKRIRSKGNDWVIMFPESRWYVCDAILPATPIHVTSANLFSRFSWTNVRHVRRNKMWEERGQEQTGTSFQGKREENEFLLPDTSSRLKTCSDLFSSSPPGVRRISVQLLLKASFTCVTLLNKDQQVDWQQEAKRHQRHLLYLM